VAGTALVMSTLAAVYPAWRAARIQPAQALRYD
jgi:ABC-type lipoprotein release transport system permease subunit